MIDAAIQDNANVAIELHSVVDPESDMSTSSGQFSVCFKGLSTVMGWSTSINPLF